MLTQNIGFIEYRFPLLNLLERAAYGDTWQPCASGGIAHRAGHAHREALRERALRAGCLPTLPSFRSASIRSRFRPANANERLASRARRLGVASDRPTLMFAGRLVEKKGVPLVLDVAQAMPDVLIFLLAGDGPLRTLLQNAPSNVVWLREVDAVQHD